MGSRTRLIIILTGPLRLLPWLLLLGKFSRIKLELKRLRLRCRLLSFCGLWRRFGLPRRVFPFGQYDDPRNPGSLVFAVLRVEDHYVFRQSLNSFFKFEAIEVDSDFLLRPDGIFNRDPRLFANLFED